MSEILKLILCFVGVFGGIIVLSIIALLVSNYICKRAEDNRPLKLAQLVARIMDKLGM